MVLSVAERDEALKALSTSEAEIGRWIIDMVQAGRVEGFNHEDLSPTPELDELAAKLEALRVFEEKTAVDIHAKMPYPTGQMGKKNMILVVMECMRGYMMATRKTEVLCAAHNEETDCSCERLHLSQVPRDVLDAAYAGASMVVQMERKNIGAINNMKTAILRWCREKQFFNWEGILKEVWRGKPLV